MRAYSYGELEEQLAAGQIHPLDPDAGPDLDASFLQLGCMVWGVGCRLQGAGCRV